MGPMNLQKYNVKMLFTWELFTADVMKLTIIAAE